MVSNSSSRGWKTIARGGLGLVARIRIERRQKYCRFQCSRLILLLSLRFSGSPNCPCYGVVLFVVAEIRHEERCSKCLFLSIFFCVFRVVLRFVVLCSGTARDAGRLIIKSPVPKGQLRKKENKDRDRHLQCYYVTSSYRAAGQWVMDCDLPKTRCKM